MCSRYSLRSAVGEGAERGVTFPLFILFFHELLIKIKMFGNLASFFVQEIVLSFLKKVKIHIYINIFRLVLIL